MPTPIAEQLKALKERSNMTVQELSSLSDIPVSTINRILSGETQSPNFYTVCSLVLAMNGSLDELVGAAKEDSTWEEIAIGIMQVMKNTGTDSNLEALQSAIGDLKDSHETSLQRMEESSKTKLEELRKVYEARIAEMELRIQEIKTSRKYFALLTTLLLAFVLIILGVDILNGNFGYFKY